MDDYVCIAELSAELGLNRDATRECLRTHGIKVRKLFLHGRDDCGTHAVTRADAERIRNLYQANSASRKPSSPRGYFYVVQLVPDLEPRRIKIGFAHDVAARVEQLQTAAPTAVITRSWPCKSAWTAAAMDCVTASGCNSINNDVFDCDDLAACVARGESFFAILPPPHPTGSPSLHTHDTVTADWQGNGSKRN